MGAYCSISPPIVEYAVRGLVPHPEILENLPWHTPPPAGYNRWGDHVGMMTDTLEQAYRAVQERCGLIDWPAWGLIHVGGADRAGFLHHLLSNDIKALQPGGGCEAALLTAAGKLLAPLIVLADSDAHWLLVDRARLATVVSTLERYHITEDVTLTDVSADWTAFALQGPQSPALLKNVFRRACALSKPLAHGLVIHPARDGTSQRDVLRYLAYPLTRHPGALLIVPPRLAEALRDLLRQHGADAVGSETLNVLRIEAGMPWYGLDMDEANLLPETGLAERLVSYTKGCYVGQEVIARLQTYGSVSQALMGLACEGSIVPAPGDEIVKEGQPIGRVTSACFSPALKGPIALGLVKRPHYVEGIPIEILHAGRAISSILAQLPFVPPHSP